MTHSPHTGEDRGVFEREFALLDDLVRGGSNPEFEHLKSVIADAEFERREAEAAALRLAADLELTTAGREGALRQLAEANVREGQLSSMVLGLRFALGEAERDRDLLRTALERVVGAVMHGAPDPLAGALDALERVSGALAVAARPTPHLAVAA